MSIPKLPEEKAIWAADQFIEYYSKFNRIDDYLRFVKESRISKSSSKLFGPEDDIFSDFHIHPNDMDFSIHVVDTSSKPTTRYNQELYSEILHDTASNPIEEAIPGRTLKWIVIENTTNKVVGVIRFGSPTINSKPRNNYFKEIIPLSKINQEFVMGFNIVPVQPFGFNYLGGKLLALLASSNELKRQFDKKYDTDLKYLKQLLCMELQKEFQCMMVLNLFSDMLEILKVIFFHYFMMSILEKCFGGLMIMQIMVSV